MSRSIYIGVLFIAVSWTTCLQAAEAPACQPWSAKVVSIQGKVEVRHNNTADWQNARLEQVYCNGDSLRVGQNSRAAVVLINQTLLRLDQNSAITFTTVEADKPSLLDILTGWVHFISRVPHSLQVNTPYVNAAIEGTEFVVAVTDKDASVTVFEGKVRASNTNGEVRITHNETAIATAGTAPQKVLLAKPRDAVQWALYYPPLLSADDPLHTAAELLYRGRVAEARAAMATVPDLDKNGNAKALNAIIAVVNNDKAAALQLAQEGVQLSPNSPATYIALSYAQQAHFDLDAALASAHKATDVDHHNALAHARVAELQLSLGHLSDGLKSAQNAVQLDPHLARAHTLQGFAALMQIKIDAALTSFDKAIQLDEVDPLPHLGRGLALIRRNELNEGRREIEIAALLDPNNALIRSYLGKAYFEEKRPGIDADQFAMAKELDPNDPTPWFYDAIRKQTENRPVEALDDLQKSIELNDNRAVYRSRLQLDQDEAARSASLARIYQDLGFQETAILEATKSIDQDPTNYSAHELLSDAYLSQPRQEIARVSEALQARLLNPLNLNPQQPQLNQGSLTLLNNLGTNNPTNMDYNSLFRRNSSYLTFNVLQGGNNTEGREGVISGSTDHFAYSLGTYTYKTDGVHANNGQEQTLYNYFVQSQLSSDFSISVEVNRKKEILGDVYRFDPRNFQDSLKTTDDIDNKRFSFRSQPNEQNLFVASYLNQSRQFDYFISYSGLGDYTETTKYKNTTFDARYFYTNAHKNATIGYSATNSYLIDDSTFAGSPFPTTYNNVNDSVIYAYTNFELLTYANLLLGLSYDTYRDSDFYIANTNPKFGLILKPSDRLTIRTAYFETVKRSYVDDSTLEPTSVAGFSQFYDDEIKTKTKQSAYALDISISRYTKFGIEYDDRDQIVHRLLTDPMTFNTYPGIVNRSQKLGLVYFNTAISKNLNLTAKYISEKIDHGSYYGNDTYEYVLTKKIPITFNLVFDKYKLNFIATHVYQEGSFINTLNGNASYGNDTFWTLDTSIIYTLPNRNGSLSIGIKNLTNASFNYEETDRKNPTISPERLGYVHFNFYF